MQPDPHEHELAEYVRSQLRRLGPYFDEPEVVQEALEHARDLWVQLYELDHSLTSEP